MSNRTRFRGTRRFGVALAVGLTSLAAPSMAQAAEVDLGGAHPFSVLAGVSATNTGPSVLAGDLGLHPGVASDLSGFGTATIGGATHTGDAVALTAQTNLTTAYNVAAAEPSSVNRTGTDLASDTLIPGTYTWSSNANLSGTVTLDAQGDPAARFLFQIGSSLNTASGFNVVLAPGTSPCNIYWQVGSSATIGTTNTFVGTIMANNNISLNTGTTMFGSALARVGQVTLDTNTFIDSGCTRGGTTTQGTPATPAATTPPPVGVFPAPPAANTAQPPPGSRTTVRTRRGTSRLRTTLRTTLRRPRGQSTCTDGFTARVRGRMIKSVVFRLDGRRIANRRRSPFRVYVKASPGGRHKVTARVTYRDATRAKTMTLRYRACAAAVLQPRRGPSRFTG